MRAEGEEAEPIKEICEVVNSKRRRKESVVYWNSSEEDIPKKR